MKKTNFQKKDYFVFVCLWYPNCQTKLTGSAGNIALYTELTLELTIELLPAAY